VLITRTCSQRSELLEAVELVELVWPKRTAGEAKSVASESKAGPVKRNERACMM
jgi:hypothetical protein